MCLSIFIASVIELSYAMAQEEEKKEDLDALVKESLVHVHCFDGSVVRRSKMVPRVIVPQETMDFSCFFTR